MKCKKKFKEFSRNSEGDKFDNPDVLLGNAGAINSSSSRFPCSELALQAWHSIKDKELYYQRTNGKIRPNWKKPKDKKVDGYKQLKIYVEARAELPSLSLRYLRQEQVTGNLSSVMQLRVYKKFQTTYRIMSQWLEFLLLHKQEVLPELRFTNKKHLERLAKHSASLYQLIQELWSRAEVYQDNLCEWVLHYDSPAQIWFDVEACLCVEDMLRTMTAPEQNKALTKDAYYTNVQKFKQAVLEPPNSFQLIVGADKEQEIVAPDIAIHLTAIEARRQGSTTVPGSYQRYLEAWNSEASYRRRTKQLQHIS